MADISKILFYEAGRPKQLNNATSSLGGDVLRLNNITVDELLTVANLSIQGSLDVAGDINSSGSTNIVTGDQFIDLNANADGTSKAGGLAVVHNVINTANVDSCTASTNLITFDAAITPVGATGSINGTGWGAGDSVTITNADGSTNTFTQTAYNSLANLAAVIQGESTVSTATVNGNNIDVTFVAGYRHNAAKFSGTINGSALAMSSAISGGVGFSAGDIIVAKGFEADGAPEMNGLYAITTINLDGSSDQESVNIGSIGGVTGADFLQTNIQNDVAAGSSGTISTCALTAIAVADGANVKNSLGAISKGSLVNLRLTDFAISSANTIHRYEVSNVGLQDVYNVGNEITMTTGNDFIINKPTSGNSSISLQANGQSNFTVESAGLTLETNSDSNGNSGALQVRPSDKGAQYGIKEFVQSAGIGNDAALYPLDLATSLAIGDLVKITPAVAPSVTFTVAQASATANITSITLSILSDLTNGSTQNVTLSQPADFTVTNGDASATANSIKTAIQGVTPTLSGTSLFVEVLANGNDYDIKVSHEGVGALGNVGSNAVSGSDLSVSNASLQGGTNAKVEKASAVNYASCKGLIGFCMDATGGTVNAFDSIRVAGAGSLLETSSASVSYGDMGKPIYLSASTAGAMTVQDPTGSNQCVYQVGVAVGVNQLYVLPQFIAELP